MKIAILVGAFPPKWLAGTEIATYNIATYLARWGHEVHVITSLDEGLPKASLEEGFYVHRIFWRKIRFLGIISFWIKIFWHLKKIKPDIIHVQSVGIGIPGFLAKIVLKKPFVVYGRGSEVYLPLMFTNTISKLVLKNADAVIALTEDMKGEMQKIYDRDIFVIPNGINLERFKNLSKGDIRGKGGKTILFVGTLCPVKGLTYLIEAMKITRDKNKDIRLMLVGSGEERVHLEVLIKKLKLKKCVNFIGKVPNEEVPEYMFASDVFVLPSLSEGFPNVVLEAMASGLPIVATNVGGLSEIIKDGENGFVVEPKSPKQIAEMVLMLLEDDELRERISKNNKKRVKDYSLESVVARLEEIYRSYL
jgi:glycosyltransferase involved in cell wall biosynthesis